MKPEKEVFWLVNLLNSKFVKKRIGACNCGCKSDFEKVAGASINDKIFNKWADYLIEIGIFEFSEIGYNKTNIPVKLYFINGSKLIKRLREIPFYLNVVNVIRLKETAFGF